MKTAIATIVLAVMLATSVPVNAASESLEGESTDCLDYLVLYEVPGVESPTASYVDDVTPGEAYEIFSGDGDAFVDFFDAGGVSVGYGASGTVPDGADYGIACVWVGGVAPVGPASWTYTEG